MVPGEDVGISLQDVRDIPTLVYGYGRVPITHTSAATQRILSLAYLLVWAWYEHTQASQLLGQKPVDHMVLLIDEVEDHLHPRWQRVLLPALLRVVEMLSADIQVQIIAATHSPMVLASVEPILDEEQDRLLNFELEDRQVVVREIPWAKQGDAVGWLVSEAFGLDQARSREAEVAIEAAEAYMRGDLGALPEGLASHKQIHSELRRVLTGHDPFWPRWIVKTEGVGR